MFNEISRLISNRKIPRARIKGGLAFSGGDWKDIINTERDREGNEWYCILVGEECGQQITRWHLKQDITIKMFDIDIERKEKEVKDRRGDEYLRGKQAEINHINAIRLEIDRLRANGYRGRAAMLQYDLNNGLI